MGVEQQQVREITKWDIFYYVYALLHHPGYRERYADNLKRELPRIPFAPDFWAFAQAGQKLAQLHLNYETVEPYPLEFRWTAGKPVSWRGGENAAVCRQNHAQSQRLADAGGHSAGSIRVPFRQSQRVGLG